MSESPWGPGGLIPSTTFPDYTLAWLVAELQEQVKLLTWLLAEQTYKTKCCPSYPNGTQWGHDYWCRKAGFP